MPHKKSVVRAHLVKLPKHRPNPDLTAQTACGPDASSAGVKIGTAKDRSMQSELWTHEAIEYLGLNRLDLSRPDMALQRLIKKGALKPTKIGGRLVFKKAELDRILEKGDEVRGRGRPRKTSK